MQHQHNNLGPLPHASAVPTAAAGASAALPSASSEAGAAPPAAPPSQFTSPEAAIDSGAVAVSRQAAAAASTPATPAALADAQQRQALQAAAAVATEAAAEVLSAEGGEVEQLVDEEEHREAGEGDAALEQDIRGEVHLPAGEEGLVVTRDGKTALPPTSPAKGAGGYRRAAQQIARAPYCLACAPTHQLVCCCSLVPQQRTCLAPLPRSTLPAACSPRARRIPAAARPF